MSSTYDIIIRRANERRLIVSQVLSRFGMGDIGQKPDHVLNSCFRVFAATRKSADFAALHPTTLAVLASEGLRKSSMIYGGLAYFAGNLPLLINSAQKADLVEKFGEGAVQYMLAQSSARRKENYIFPTVEDVEIVGSMGMMRWIAAHGPSDLYWIKLLVEWKLSETFVDVGRASVMVQQAWNYLGSSDDGSH